MKAKLSKKEKGFADDYIETGNGTLAIKKNYDVSSDNSAGSMATQNLRKLKIQEYIASKAEDASTMIYDLSQNGEAEIIRLNASKDILDRAGFKPIDKSVNLNLEIETEANEELKELTKRLDELDRTRTKSITGDGITSNSVDSQVSD